jgi:hypothetical protein
MSPPPETDLFSETSPVVAALVRLMIPGSWPVLRAHHFKVVLEVEDQPVGFLDLVIEESARIMAEVSDRQPVLETMLLISAFVKRHGLGLPFLASSVQRSMVLLADVRGPHDEIGEARRWLIEAARPHVSQDVETELRLLRMAGDHEEAFTLSVQVSPIRQLEVLADLVAARRDAGGRDDLSRLISTVTAARQVARSAKRDVVRAHVLCHSGWHLARLARVFLDRWPPSDPQPALAIVAELADELASAESLVRALGADVTEGFWLLALGRLRLHHTPLHAVEPLRRAVDLLTACGAGTLAQDARDALAEATGERPPEPGEPSGSSGTPTSTQTFPPDKVQ